MTNPFPAIFDPLTIGHLTLKTRVMSTSHSPAYADDGKPKRRYQLYHEEKAKGGIPDVECIDGAQYVVSVWDILGGHASPGLNVLLFDDHGSHQGPSCAEYLASAGSRVELVTPDRSIAHDMVTINFSVHLRHLYKAGVKLTPDERVISVKPAENGLRVHLRNEYSAQTSERLVDQVVVEQGRSPSIGSSSTLRLIPSIRVVRTSRPCRGGISTCIRVDTRQASAPHRRCSAVPKYSCSHIRRFATVQEFVGRV